MRRPVTKEGQMVAILIRMPSTFKAPGGRREVSLPARAGQGTIDPGVTNPRSGLPVDDSMTAASFLLGRFIHFRATHCARGPVPGRMVTVLVMILIVGAQRPVSSAPPAQDGSAFFERNIRPLLAQRCYECHSKQAKKPRGGLTL